MSNKILVAYATKAGSTAEVADVVGEELSKAGLDVEVCKTKEVKNLDAYQGIVLGTAVRMGRPISGPVRFAKKYRKALTQKPVALFSVGLTMNEDTPENREKAAGFLTPLCEIMEPVDIATFGGKLDFSTIGPIFRFTFSKADDENMTEGDWRNWDEIRSWAANLPAVLFPA
jgi:menaquinone-dependent protoporphyrinogen oxidase